MSSTTANVKSAPKRKSNGAAAQVEQPEQVEAKPGRFDDTLAAAKRYATSDTAKDAAKLAGGAALAGFGLATGISLAHKVFG